MNNKLEYKGYTGSVNYCANDKILYGKIIDTMINDVIKPCLDVISYEGSSVYEIEKSFQEAVEDYFDISKEVMDDTFTIICNKCGKEQPIDKKQSNKNWKVYMNVKYCKCGGKFEIQF